MANCYFLSFFWVSPACYKWVIRDLAVLFLNLLATVARLADRRRPGCGGRVRFRQAATADAQSLAETFPEPPARRSPHRRRMHAAHAPEPAGPFRQSAIVLKPSTLLRLHRALIRRKYRRLFSAPVPTKPGPKGRPRLRHSDEQGCRATHSRRSVPAKTGRAGSSWLTGLGHAKDSLWSVDPFRCESAWIKAGEHVVAWNSIRFCFVSQSGCQPTGSFPDCASGGTENSVTF
jgi:hypothetical protein